ncbi:unnamed protein product [Gadus morhua 'NCC']
MGALGLLLLLGLLSGGSAEFVSVGMVDEVQFLHYDSVSERAVPKQAWMDQLTTEDRDYWEGETGRYQSYQQVSKVNVETAKKRFNQTGVPTCFSGCLAVSGMMRMILLMVITSMPTMERTS